MKFASKTKQPMRAFYETKAGTCKHKKQAPIRRPDARSEKVAWRPRAQAPSGLASSLNIDTRNNFGVYGRAARRPLWHIPCTQRYEAHGWSATSQVRLYTSARTRRPHRKNYTHGGALPAITADDEKSGDALRPGRTTHTHSLPPSGLLAQQLGRSDPRHQGMVSKPSAAHSKLRTSACQSCVQNNVIITLNGSSKVTYSIQLAPPGTQRAQQGSARSAQACTMVEDGSARGAFVCRWTRGNMAISCSRYSAGTGQPCRHSSSSVGSPCTSSTSCRFQGGSADQTNLLMQSQNEFSKMSSGMTDSQCLPYFPAYTLVLKR